MPQLANEFNQKLNKQNEELTRSKDTPQEHPEDILVIRNILVDDNNEINDTIPYSQSQQDIDPTTGQAHFINRQQTNQYLHKWNTKDYFEVRWDGRPHRIEPGKIRLMPRYLGEHFAKHLIDYILTREEDKRKVTNLKNNMVRRQGLYNQIVEKVESYYNGGITITPGQQVEQQVQELNQNDPKAHDLGEVPNPALGYTHDKPEEQVPEVPKTDTDKPQAPRTREEIVESKTKKQLLDEAKQLGLQVKGTENKYTLYDMIVGFVGG